MSGSNFRLLLKKKLEYNSYVAVFSISEINGKDLMSLRQLIERASSVYLEPPVSISLNVYSTSENKGL